MRATISSGLVLSLILWARVVAAQPDANCDGALSAADLVTEVGALLGDRSSCGVGDANCDGAVDRTDVDDLLHALFGNPLCAPRIPSTTFVLDADTSGHLVGMGDDGTLRFDRSSPMLEDLVPGDILVSGVTDTLSAGLLRKVVSVTIGGGVVVDTEPATLEEAIGDGSTAVRMHLDSAALHGARVAPNVTARALSGPGATQGFYFEVRDFVVYDNDGDESTSDDQARVTGSVALDPTVDFLLDVQRARLRRFRFILHTTESIAVEGTVTIPFLTPNLRKYEHAQPVATLAPIVIYIGLFPVVIQPQINLVLGVMPDLFTGARVEASQQSVLSVGVQFENDSWSPIGNFTADLAYRPPTLTAGFVADFYAGTELELKLYGIAGPHIAAKGFVALDADISRAPWWQLYGGLRADSGVRIVVLSERLADVDFPNVIGYRRLLAEAVTNRPTRTAISTPTKTAARTFTPTTANTPTVAKILSPSPTASVLSTATTPPSLSTHTATAISTGTAGQVPTATATATATRTQPPAPSNTPTQTPPTTPTTTSGRFVDDGEGTVTDTQTGLMWEKKDQAGGMHDQMNGYLWAGLCSDGRGHCQRNTAAATTCAAATGGAYGCALCRGSATCDTFGGSTIWDWLNQLNGATFAGHSDWRIPTVAKDGGMAELESIIQINPGCTGGLCAPAAFDSACTPGCTVLSCSCTDLSVYWSAITETAFPAAAWAVSFIGDGGGHVYHNNKANSFPVRAVRGGVSGTPALTGTPANTPTSIMEVPTATATPTPSDTERFVDNGDGTVTDTQTGLMWEKQDQGDGLHDATTYPWSGRCSDTQTYCQIDAAAAATCTAATGGAYGCALCSGSASCIMVSSGTITVWDWLNQLNGAMFAGYSDWRIPTIGQDGGMMELETIVDLNAPGCGYYPFPSCVPPIFDTGCSEGCTVLSCSCTQASGYWSANSSVFATTAWGVFFDGSGVIGREKPHGFYVRAVRGGIR